MSIQGKQSAKLAIPPQSVRSSLLRQDNALTGQVPDSCCSWHSVSGPCLCPGALHDVVGAVQLLALRPHAHRVGPVVRSQATALQGPPSEPEPLGLCTPGHRAAQHPAAGAAASGAAAAAAAARCFAAMCPDGRSPSDSDSERPLESCGLRFICWAHTVSMCPKPHPELSHPAFLARPSCSSRASICRSVVFATALRTEPASPASAESQPSPPGACWRQ